MQIQENIALAPYTTLHIGGPARYFVRVETEQHLVDGLRFARDRGLPLLVLGGGSNLVVPDHGFTGLVLLICLQGPLVRELESDTGAVRYHVPAGIAWNDLVRVTAENGLTGMECLAGIPGTVGASPVQNIGAYGQEVAQTIESVRVLDRQTMEFRTLTAQECDFRYRASIFNSTQRGRFLITRVVFRFAPNATAALRYGDLQKHFGPGATPTPMQIYLAVREIRARKGMLIDPAEPDADTRSAGSFFKNPVVPLAAVDRIATALDLPAEQVPHWPVASHPESADPGGTVPGRVDAGETKLPAAWLIERAGFPKGFALGPVGISTRHTLALVNRTGTATCADLFQLRDLIMNTVEQRFDIRLEQEPVMPE